MNIEEFRDYCLQKAEVTESFPFDKNTLVFKVCNKMFAACDVEVFESINLKCDPERALELRAEYPGIIPGYHMNKKHWNTIMTDGSVPNDLLIDLIDHSYSLVLSKLPKKIQQQITEK